MNKLIILFITVSFTQTYIVDVTIPSGGGRVCGAGVYMKGNNPILTATPLPTYVFISWTENKTILDTVQTLYLCSIINSRNIVANFKKKIVPTNSKPPIKIEDTIRIQ